MDNDQPPAPKVRKKRTAKTVAKINTPDAAAARVSRAIAELNDALGEAVDTWGFEIVIALDPLIDQHQVETPQVALRSFTKNYLAPAK